MHGAVDILKTLVGVAVPLAALATGLGAANADPWWLWKRPGLLARSLLVLLVLVPVGAVLFLELIHAAPIVKAGLTIAVLSIGIGPPAAFKRARAQTDTLSFDVGLNILLLILAIVYIPAAVALHGAIFGHSLRLGLGAVAGLVFSRALLPMLVGVLLARLFPRAVAPLGRFAAIVVQVVLLVVLALALVATWRSLIGLGGKAWLTCVAIALGEIAIGHLFGGPERQTRRVLAAFSSMRFPALALLVVSLAPQGRAFTPVVVSYVLTTFVLVAVYDAVMAFLDRRTTPRHRPPVAAVAQARA